MDILTSVANFPLSYTRSKTQTFETVRTVKDKNTFLLI